MTTLKIPAGVSTEVEDLARTYVLLADEQHRELHATGSPAHERLMGQRVRVFRQLTDLGWHLELDGDRYVLEAHARILDMADVA